MKEKTSICLLTCNRKEFSKRTIDGLYERLTNPEFIHLIVVDNNSTDGTVELLEEYRANNKISELILLVEGQTVNISQAYNICFKYVKSEYMFCMQDDIVISKLEPDISEQLIMLMEKYPDHGTIGAKIQRVPNLQINLANDDLIPARKSISAYFRICKKSDMLKLGEYPFSQKEWDDRAMKVQMDKLGKKSSWCKNIWVNHLGYMAENRGYPIGCKRMWGWNKRASDNIRKPYPRINNETCEPLPGEKCYR